MLAIDSGGKIESCSRTAEFSWLPETRCKSPVKLYVKPVVGLNFSEKPVSGCHLDRFDAGIARARRAKWIPIYSEGRAQVVATAVLPLALYGCLSSHVPQRKMQALRSACTSAILGRGRARRCPEAVSAFLARPHRADPITTLPYERLLQLRRWLQVDRRWWWR